MIYKRSGGSGLPTADRTRFLRAFCVAAAIIKVIVVIAFITSTVISSRRSFPSAGGSLPSLRKALSAAPSGGVQQTRAIQISVYPRIFYLQNIVSAVERAAIIVSARPKLNFSQTVGGVVSKVRTSEGMFMQTAAQLELVRPVADRVAAVVGIPPERFEAMQVLRYAPGQQYHPHPDYFEGELLRGQMGHGGQRIATIIMFLNHVRVGGHTDFPAVNISIAPVAGDGVVFWSMNPAGDLEPRSFHAGRPPGAGEEKWVAVYWMREQRFGG